MFAAGFDFYAGGDAKGTQETYATLQKRAGEEGYTIARGYSDYKAKANDAEKMMLFQKDYATELPYAINRKADDLTLAQITAAGIDFLEEKSKKGFFMMVEGGKIDYAAHNDDGATVFQEVIDFNAAIEEARSEAHV